MPFQDVLHCSKFCLNDIAVINLGIFKYTAYIRSFQLKKISVLIGKYSHFQLTSKQTEEVLRTPVTWAESLPYGPRQQLAASSYVSRSAQVRTS